MNEIKGFQIHLNPQSSSNHVQILRKAPPGADGNEQGIGIYCDSHSSASESGRASTNFTQIE